MSAAASEEKVEAKIVEFKKPNDGKKPHLWSVAAGKGGVGKSFISTSLAITLSRMGHTVTLIDLDVSGANVHTCLGLNPCSKNLNSFLKGETTQLNDLATPTALPKLSYIQGLWDSWESYTLTIEDSKKLAIAASHLKTDYVIFDLGAGNSESHLELLKNSDEKIIVSQPEPTSVERTYRFLESYILYALKNDSNANQIADLVKELRNHRLSGAKHPFSFRQYLSVHCPDLVSQFEKYFVESPVRLIMNGTRSHSDHDLGYSVKSICNKYYNMNLHYIGWIDFDNAVWQSVRKRQPPLVEYPFIPMVGQFMSICKQLVSSNLHPNLLKAVV